VRGASPRLSRTIATAITGLVATTIPVAAASAADATTNTVVYGFGDHQVGWAHPEVRPSRATFGLAGEDGIRRIRWQDWKRSGGGSFTAEGGTRRPQGWEPGEWAGPELL
jgi:hypothetical protein